MKGDILTVCLCVSGDSLGDLLSAQIAQGGVFGPTQPVHLILHGDNTGQPDSLEGLRMELVDCAFPLLSDVTVASSLSQLSQSPDVAVIVMSDSPVGGQMESSNGQGLRNPSQQLAQHVERMSAQLNERLPLKVIVLGDQALPTAALLSHLLPGLGPSQLLAVTGDTYTAPRSNDVSSKRRSLPLRLVSQFTSTISQWWSGQTASTERTKKPTHVQLGTKYHGPRERHNMGYFFNSPVDLTGPQTFKLCSSGPDTDHARAVMEQTDTLFHQLSETLANRSRSNVTFSQL